MTVSINLKKIGYKNPVKVRETFSNVKAVLNFQKDMDSLNKPKEEIDNMSDEDLGSYFINLRLKSMDYTLDFVESVLNLSDKKKDELMNLEYEDIQTISAEINDKILRLNQDSNKSDDKGKK